MTRCFFCQGRIEIAREAFSNACARCSERQCAPRDPIAAFDGIAAEFRDFRDAIEFGRLPKPGQYVSSEVMERARMAKWCAPEDSIEHHKAAYWYDRLFKHNCALAASRPRAA